MTRLVIVTPVYEDAATSAKLFGELANLFGERAYIVAVDDGSLRAPVDPTALAAARVAGVVIRLRSNVGHQRAIAIGLNYAVETIETDTIVIMDSDGEDIPQSIVELVRPLETTDIDIVVAQRRKRVETMRFRLFYCCYQWLFRLLTGHRIRFGNFMAMKPVAARHLACMPELWTHVAASVLASKLRIAAFPIDRGPRYAGMSKMRFSSLALHGLRALAVFAEVALLRIGIASAIAAVISVIAGIITAIFKLDGHAAFAWIFTAPGLLFILSVQTGVTAFIALLLVGPMRNLTFAGPDYRQFIDDIRHVERDA